MPGERLVYGNWIRRRVLWRLGGGVVISAVAVLLPIHPILRGTAAVLFVLLATSFLFPAYAYYAFSPRGGNLQERVFDKIVETLGDPRPATILDIGTGNGVLAVKLAERFPQSRTMAIDFWGEAWEYAKSVCEENARIANVAGAVLFTRGDAAAMDFEDASFDVVVSNLTFHEVDAVSDKRIVVAEALRTLKRGGAFVFVDYFYQPKIYGPTSDFTGYVRTLIQGDVALDPMGDIVPLSRLLRHPRVLGKVGMLHGTK